MAALGRHLSFFRGFLSFRRSCSVASVNAALSKQIFNLSLSIKSNFNPDIAKSFSTDAKDTRPHVNIGTIGHIDHGKTTLTAAITKVMAEQGKSKFRDYGDIDSAPQEQARGITINVCHVEYSTKVRHYAHTDCPGHIDYIKNMICGTAQMDGAILVIAATDGTMPQTTEHLALAKVIGVKNIVVYVNKADLVDNEVLELVEIETRELLDEIGFDGENTPIVSGSALCALNDIQHDIGRDSIFKLMDAIDEHIPLPVRDTSGSFFLPIEKTVSVPGRGTVAVGTLLRGTMLKSKNAELLGFGHRIKTTLTDIQVFQKSVQAVHAGENCGVLLRGIRNEIVERGMALAEPGSVQIHNHFEANLYIRTRQEGGRKKPITTKYINQMFLDTWSAACCVMLPEGMSMAMPGDTITATVILRKSMVLQEGQKFVIRDNEYTSMTGVISKILPDNDLQIKGFNHENQKRMKVLGKPGAGTIRSRRNKKK